MLTTIVKQKNYLVLYRKARVTQSIEGISLDHTI